MQDNEGHVGLLWKIIGGGTSLVAAIMVGVTIHYIEKVDFERDRMLADIQEIKLTVERRAGLIETSVLPLRTQFDRAKEDINELQRGLRSEAEFCRQTVIPMIVDLRKDMVDKIKVLGGG